MPKLETKEQKEKRKFKEARELVRWEKVMAKKKPSYYFIVLAIVLCIVYIVDEISTNINGSLQSNIILDLFNITSGDTNSPEYKEGLSALTFVSMFAMVFLFLAPFYKSLADRLGRKLFLVINTAGMIIGMLIIMLSTSIVFYVLGLVIINFVVPNDVQVMYIMEVSPEKHRAKFCNIAKACGILGISSIGLLRRMFIVEGDMDSWRMVFLIPIIIGAVALFLTLFFARETPVFLKERTAYLRSTDEERTEKAKQEKEKKEVQGGVIRAIKFIFKHKQTRWIFIVTCVFMFCSVTTSFWETILSQGGLSTDDISNSVLFYPFIYALVTLISGFFSDKFGRRVNCLFFGTLSILSLVGFIVLSKYTTNGIVCGLLYGAFVGGLWSTGDTLLMVIMQESCPTELRASTVGVHNLLSMVPSGIMLMIVTVLQNFLDLAWMCLAISVPAMATCIILLFNKVHETKHVDLNTVTGAEWDIHE